MGGKARAWLAVGVWAVVIFAFSSRPGPAVPFTLFPQQDKVGHFFLYCIFGMLLFKALREVRYAAFWAVLIAAAYAVTDEYHQGFVENRIASVADLCADTLGAAFAQLVMIAKGRRTS